MHATYVTCSFFRKHIMSFVHIIKNNFSEATLRQKLTHVHCAVVHILLPSDPDRMWTAIFPEPTQVTTSAYLRSSKLMALTITGV
jgi:hypothetical protein